MAKCVLIVDDDPVQRRLLQAATEKHRFRARLAENGEQAIAELSKPGNGVDIVLLDLIMPGLSGMETLTRLTARHKELPVIVLTASGGIDTVVEAMRQGAADFLIKPAAPERIAVSIRNALRIRRLNDEVHRLTRKANGMMQFTDMIGKAPSIRSAIAMGEKAAAASIPVLILGESGTGKEIMARCIQGSSARAGQPFITVNCGAIPENLIESTLFGHEKGAFTGAVESRPGKFREADGGTLFLDEVGELAPEMQVRLLRALQEGEIDPVGAAMPVKVDLRIISATNRNLEQSVKQGSFREDLYYRLNVFPLNMPPLRERMEDLPALIEHFISRFNSGEGRQINGISSEAMSLLMNHDWPGNIRQLENAIFRAIVLCQNDRLDIDDFPHLAPNTDKDHAEISLTDHNGKLRSLDAIEQDMVNMALQLCKGDAGSAASQLRIRRNSALYRRLCASA